LITDLTPRDGQQCKLATRVRTDDLLPLCEKLDKVGFYAVEVWGGATYDVCLRYLKEDPWERLRRIKEVMPNTKLQMLFRGQNIVGYRPKSDKLVYKFVERAIANGITVFRVFDALNDNRNIEVPVKAIKELGGEAHAEISYTRSPVHTYQKWIEYALEIAEMGADWLSFKDATGIIMPLETYTIIKGIKEATGGKLPVLLHNHDMSGTAIVNHMMAILAGVDMVDTVLSPLAFGSSHPATESVGAYKVNTLFFAKPCKMLILRQKSIARVYGVCTHFKGKIHYAFCVQVSIQWINSDHIGLIGHLYMPCGRFYLVVYGNRFYPQLFAGPYYPTGYFTPVGYKYLFEHTNLLKEFYFVFNGCYLVYHIGYGTCAGVVYCLVKSLFHILFRNMSFYFYIKVYLCKNLWIAFCYPFCIRFYLYMLCMFALLVESLIKVNTHTARYGMKEKFWRSYASSFATHIACSVYGHFPA